MMKRNLLLGYLVAVTACGVGCGPKPESSSPAAAASSALGPLKIGVAAPLTGSQAKIGSDMALGVEMAVAEWNAKGGVLGRKIELVRGDDEATPKQATAVARQLVNEGVAGVIGHFNSGCTIPASQIYNDAKVVAITPASTNPTVTDSGFVGMFRVCGRDDQQGSVAGKYAVNVLKAGKIAILHDKTAYGQGLADEFKKTIEALGVKPVYYGGVPKEETDFRAVVTAIKNTEPDLWYFGGIYDQGGPLLNQARQVGLTAPLMSGDGLIDKELIKTAGMNAEGTFLTFGPDPAKVPSAKSFLERYKQLHGEPGPYSIYGYDACNVLLAGIQNAGSAEFKEVTGHLHANKFDTAMGTIAFDAKGDIKGSYYVMWVVKDGEFVLAETQLSQGP
jgi:branched-chain amino acid transport system substrate-binding protein